MVLRVLAVLAALLSAACAHAPPGTAHGHGGSPLPGACEQPSAANEGAPGCWFDSAVELGVLEGDVYYHVDEFDSTRAATAARTGGGAVVRAYGRVFLETVNTEGGWRPNAGTRLATVGPMPAPRGGPVTARYMQAMTRPGARTRPHRHDGPEAFVLLSGAICVETPDGAATTSAGETYWARGGVPMQLTSAAGLRRSLFVVLHPSWGPWMTMTPEWTPRGLCAPEPSGTEPAPA